MTSSVVYDVAVIGAGVIGSAAACQIVKTGATVILLEQVQCLWRCSYSAYSKKSIQGY